MAKRQKLVSTRERSPIWARSLIIAALCGVAATFTGAAKATNYFGTVLHNPQLYALAQGASGSAIVGFRSDQGTQKATIWSFAARSQSITIHPSGATVSEARGTDGRQVVGYGNGVGAFLWESAVGHTILHPLGEANAVSDGIQVGAVGNAAWKWNGVAPGVPLPGDGSKATGVRVWNGNVYISGIGGSGQSRGMLWVNDVPHTIHPPGSAFSFLHATDGLLHAGSHQMSDGIRRAFVASGNPSNPTYVDLHTNELLRSEAWAVSNGKVAGMITIPFGANSREHAVVWTQKGRIDLHQSLPFQRLGVVWEHSRALGMYGNVIVGYAVNSNNEGYAVMWSDKDDGLPWWFWLLFPFFGGLG